MPLLKTSIAGSAARCSSSSAPQSKRLGFAGIQFGCFLVFAHCFERIAGFFRDVAPQVMLPGLILKSLILKSRTLLSGIAGRTRRWRRAGDWRLPGRSAQSRDVLRQRFLCSDDRIRTVPAEIGAVCDSSDGELRFIEKFRRSLVRLGRRRALRRGNFRSFERQVNSLCLLRSKHARADCDLGVSRLFYSQKINSHAHPGKAINPGCVRVSRNSLRTILEL